MLGSAATIKICAATDISGSFSSDGYHVAVCNGSGLMEALHVVHPAATLLKDAVDGQQVCQICARLHPCWSIAAIIKYHDGMGS